MQIRVFPEFSCNAEIAKALGVPDGDLDYLADPAQTCELLRQHGWTARLFLNEREQWELELAAPGEPIYAIHKDRGIRRTIDDLLHTDFWPIADLDDQRALLFQQFYRRHTEREAGVAVTI